MKSGGFNRLGDGEFLIITCDLNINKTARQGRRALFFLLNHLSFYLNKYVFIVYLYLDYLKYFILCLRLDTFLCFIHYLYLDEFSIISSRH